MDSKIDLPAPVRSRCERTYKDRSSFALLSVLLFLEILTDSAHGFERHRAGGIDRKLVSFRPILFPIRSLQQSTCFNKGPASLEPREANVHNKPKTIGNRKGDCAWGCARGINTTWENLQIEKHNQSGERKERLPDLCFSICRFSQVVFIPRAQPHAQSLFLFPIVLVLICFIFRWEEGRCSRKFDRLFRCFNPQSHPLTEAKRRMGTVSKSATFLATESVNLAPFKRGERGAFFRKEKCKTLRQYKCAHFWQGKVQNSPPISALLRWRHFRLSLSLSLYYRKRGALGESERERKRERERERERDRERERERERETETDGSDVTIVTQKLGMSLHFPLPKIRTIGDEFTLSLAKNSHFSFLLHTSRLSPLKWLPLWRWNSQWVHTFRCQKYSPSFTVPTLANGASRATSDREPKTNDQILLRPILFFPSKIWIKLIPKTIGTRKRDCGGDKPYLRKSTDRKAQISPLSWFERTSSWFVLCDL